MIKLYNMFLCDVLSFTSYPPQQEHDSHLKNSQVPTLNALEAEESTAPWDSGTFFMVMFGCESRWVVWNVCSFLFSHRTLGRWYNLTHILQYGWLNHQPGKNNTERWVQIRFVPFFWWRWKINSRWMVVIVRCNVLVGVQMVLLFKNVFFWFVLPDNPGKLKWFCDSNGFRRNNPANIDVSW